MRRRVASRDWCESLLGSKLSSVKVLRNSEFPERELRRADGVAHGRRSRMYDATGTSETGLTNYSVHRLQTTGTLAGLHGVDGHLVWRGLGFVTRGVGRSVVVLSTGKVVVLGLPLSLVPVPLCGS